MAQGCLPPDKSGAENQPMLQAVRVYALCLIQGVLRLKRVQLSLATILVTLLIMWFPALEALRDDLMILIIGILMVALGGYSVGDAISNGHDETYERMEDLLEEIADELGIEVYVPADEAERKEVQDE